MDQINVKLDGDLLEKVGCCKYIGSHVALDEICKRVGPVGAQGLNVRYY